VKMSDASFPNANIVTLAVVRQMHYAGYY